MSVPRLAAAGLLILLTLATGAGASMRGAPAPSGLHAFLLRADEPADSSFPRTPAFAWNPVSGADHYEFQLSTSDAFRDNAIVWSTTTLQSPVASPNVSLPWITGSPHSLYARVRAVIAGTGEISPWSDDYGFDVTPPTAPTPLPSSPGLLRWSPVEGADGYQIWLVDARKFEYTFSNVLDEREFYTFHQASQWIGSVRWRVRAMRDDMLGRLNGVPVTMYGPWSPTYTSTNPNTTGGPIKLGSNVSDIVTNGASSDQAHRLMPAFTWTGNESAQGVPAELFRVYVFTDKQCLNRVYTGAVVGSPAYSGRPLGPLSLPTSAGAVTAARGTYLPDGTEPQGTTFDGEVLTTTESAPDAKPTTTLPLATTGSSSGGTGGTDTTGGGTPGSGSSSGGQSAPFINWGDSKFGAPVDLWDTNWPTGGYYWTVVPVAAVSPGALQTTVTAPGGVSGATTLPVADTTGFAPGDQISVGNAANTESAVVTAVDATSISVAAAFKLTHGPGEPVVRTGGSIRYIDMELAQDVCAAGRVARFGVSSEPSLTGAGDPFASGLSTSNTLTSAQHTSVFYRPPLVSWTPALRAEAYQVEWSKTKYPFVPEADPATGATGILTGSTSYVLPVGPGTWYYRVRGYDYSLPTGSQQMGWSDLAKITVGSPSFVVVGGDTGSASVKGAKPKAKAAAPKKAGAPRSTSATRTYKLAGFSLSLPTRWQEQTTPKGMLFAASDPVSGTATLPAAHVYVGKGLSRGSASLADWAATIRATSLNQVALPGTLKTSFVTLPAGQAILFKGELKDGNGQVHAFREYCFDNGTTSLQLLLTSLPATADAYAVRFANIASSFHFK